MTKELEAIELSLLESFHSALGKDAKANDKMRDEQNVEGVPHASAFVYDCNRRCYYQMTARGSSIDSKGSVRVWIGRKLHELQILPDGKMEQHFVLSNNGQQILQGTVDEFNDRIIIDKKTTRHMPRYAYEHHMKQVKLYNLLIAKNGLGAREYGAIGYIDVNDAAIKFFPFELKTNLVLLEKEVLQRYKKLMKSLATGILPPRTIQQWQPGSVGLVCDYCSAYSRCWREDYIDPYRKR